jgi:hypothetical protein
MTTINKFLRKIEKEADRVLRKKAGVEERDAVGKTNN